METAPPTQDVNPRTLPAMMLLGSEIQALVASVEAIDIETARGFDSRLQPAGFRLLRWLSTIGEATPSALAEGTAMDRAAASRLLVSLQNLGYVSRRPGAVDRREAYIQLTTEGQRKMDKALSDRGHALESRIEGWGVEEILRFAEDLKRFNRRALLAPKHPTSS